MKVYIKNRDRITSLQAKKTLVKALESKGHEITTNVSEANIVFVEIGKDSTLPIKPVKGQYYYKVVNGRPLILRTKDSKNGAIKVLQEGKRMAITDKYSEEDKDTLLKGIVDLIVGRVKEVNVLDPFPFDVVCSLIDATLSYGREMAIEKIKASKFMEKYGLDELSMKALDDEISKIIRIDNSSVILSMLSKTDYIQTDLLGGFVYIPNISFSIVSNLVKIQKYYNFMEISKNAEKIEVFLERARKEANELKVTVRNSLVSKNGWKLYSRNNENGIYSIFIPDNHLGICEVKIPKPTFSNIKREVDGTMVALLKDRKVLLTTEVKPKVVSFGKSLGYRIKKVDNLDETLDRLNLYPKIGDRVVVTRHPVTTLLIDCTVVGYTTDGSIRINNPMIQVLEGDADGDSLSVSWGYPMDIKFTSKEEVKEYIHIAGILTKVSYRDNNYNIDNSVKPVDIKKQTETAIEQAVAKLITKSITGAFGIAERTLILSCIIHKIKMDLEFVYTKSRISQLSVQAKNILASIKAGNIDEEAKEALKAFFILSANKLQALNTLAVFMELDVQEVISTLQLAEEVEEYREETSKLELF